jgi:hypothetical protein
MTERAFTPLPGFETLNNAIVGQWIGVLSGDTVTPIKVPNYTDVSVSVEGTLGPATFTVQGSLDGTNYYTLNDPQGNVLTFTGATMRIEQVEQAVTFLKVINGSGDGTTNVTINVTAR